MRDATLPVVLIAGGLALLGWNYGWIPDWNTLVALALMVAANFAHMAMSLVERGESGRLVCLQRGVYSDVPIATIRRGDVSRCLYLCRSL